LPSSKFLAKTLNNKQSLIRISLRTIGALGASGLHWLEFKVQSMRKPPQAKKVFLR